LGNGTENFAAFSFLLFFTEVGSASVPPSEWSTYLRCSKPSHLWDSTYQEDIGGGVCSKALQALRT
jgi:hypothetical protein